MAIEYEDQTARLSGFIGVEEAEGLLAWLQAHPQGRVDLADCAHLHTANLQVLMAARPTIKEWPADADLRVWLEAALNIAKPQ